MEGVIVNWNSEVWECALRWTSRVDLEAGMSGQDSESGPRSIHSTSAFPEKYLLLAVSI